MKFQIVVPPSLPAEISTYSPYGAMYIAAALKEDGHEVRIENGDLDKFDEIELVRRVKEFDPDAVGFSATISTSYKFVKDASRRIKDLFPEVKIIVGGGLSAAAETVLKCTAADIVVVGEGDITIKELTGKMVSGEPYDNVAGICFRQGETFVRTPPRAAITNLDTLKYPAFDLVDIEKYFIDVNKFARGFLNYKNPDPRLFEPHRSKKMFRVPISRGCINSCTFCYRSVRGIRYFSFQYIFDYVEYIMREFGINVFSFGDECFASHKAWAWRFIEELRKRKIDIMFHILGTKVETVDRDLLYALKEAGCFMIEYGFESGSQKMLDIMEKRVTVKQNIDAARWTKEAGLFTMPALVLGMPGETRETVRETIEFLKAIDYGPEWYQFTYAFAVPGTPLYEYALKTGLISDEDGYLESIYKITPNDCWNSSAFINFTSETLEEARSWPAMIHESLLRHFSRNELDYAMKKYVKSGIVLFYLKKYGLLKTCRRIAEKIFKAAKAANQEADLPKNTDRKRHLETVNKYIGKGQTGMSLRKVLSMIHAGT